MHRRLTPKLLKEDQSTWTVALCGCPNSHLPSVHHLSKPREPPKEKQWKLHSWCYKLFSCFDMTFNRKFWLISYRGNFWVVIGKRRLSHLHTSFQKHTPKGSFHLHQCKVQATPSASFNRWDAETPTAQRAELPWALGVWKVLFSKVHVLGESWTEVTFW